MPKVAVVIVTWSSKRFLEDCFASLEGQSFKDFTVTVVDNASVDDSVQFLREEYPTVSILENFKNLGFARACNQGIKLTKSDYVLIINPDVILDENFLLRLVKAADESPEVGAFGGKLYLNKTNPESIEKLSFKNNNEVDSLGLEVSKSRRVSERGEGQKDKGQFNSSQSVFGFSGACVLYRRVALEEVAVNDEYFDVDFFAYKEDVDLAWRLQLYGWKAQFEPTAVAWHRRFLGADKKRGKVSAQLRSMSLRNQHLVIIKNEDTSNLLRHLIYVVPRSLGMWGYALIFEPFQWRTLIRLFKQAPKSLQKRKIIMSHRKIGPEGIRKWFK